MEEFVKWVGPVFAAVLAGIGVALTYLQFRLKSQEHKFKLYKQRMAVYSAVFKLGFGLRLAGKIKADALQRFYDNYSPGFLLFSKPTRNLIREVFYKATNNLTNNEDLKKLDPGIERSELETKCRKRAEVLEELVPRLLRQMEKEIAPAEDLSPITQFKEWWQRISALLKQTPLYQWLKRIKWLVWFPERMK